ncbi:hypothetical protein niasHS_002034 [Heterodera schachtii]|uniref:Peptidase M12A domain-containing protein n=1 Tax=Heterodera schachtii TaxID=97005 RepID=A0ABD2K650_HETSC
MNKCLALVVLVALISALDSAVLRQRRFVKVENALKQEQKEKPAATDIVDNGNPDKIQGAEKKGPNPDEPKNQEKQGTEPNSKKPKIREAEALARKGTAPLLLKHELVKGEAITRKKRQSGGSARGDKAEKMPHKFDLTLPNEDPSESAAKAPKYAPKFERNNTPVDYDIKEKKCKVEPQIDFMSEELVKKIEKKGADQRDINAAEDGCGLKEYAEWSRCSKVAFYGRKGYKYAAEKYGIEVAEPPTKNFNDMDEFDKFGFMHDTVLLLFDGCAVCNGIKVPNVTISLLQHMPTGLLVDECKEYVNQSGKPLKLKMEMVEKQQKSKGSFAYGVSLKERLCVEKKPNTDKAEYYMQKLEYKYRVVLEVNHTCGEKAKTHYIWLPEIDVFDKETVVGRVMQIRQLKLDFTDMEDSADLTLKLSGSNFDKSGQFVNATLIPYRAEPAVPPSEQNPMVPIATNVDHLGVNCTQIVFSELMPQFFLNISDDAFAIACQKFAAPIYTGKNFSADDYYANTCAQVPTSLNCNKDHELIGCYKTKKVKHVVNNEIAEVCQKHLGNVGQPQAHGFRIRFCAKRNETEQLISVESILDFSFSDKIYKREHSYSYKPGGHLAMKEKMPFFFIEFGNAKQHSMLRGTGDGDELSSELRLTIGTILPSIANEGPSLSQNDDGGAQHRTKQLHFVPPVTEHLRIYFQTRFPIFSQRITRKTDLLPYENNPNILYPNKCEQLGNDCEPTRELLLKIQDVLQCCSPFNPGSRCLCDVPNTVDKSEFAAPPGEKGSAPDTTPSSSSNSSSRWAKLGDPLETGDILYTKEMAQRRYDDIMESCAQCVQQTTPPAEKSTKKRRKRQAYAYLWKWTKFPIALRITNKKVTEEAVLGGTALIEKDTCLKFFIDINEMEDEGIEVAHDGGTHSNIGRTGAKWQKLYLDTNGTGSIGHEFLHALALTHEQQREDAFYFIKLNPSVRDKVDGYGGAHCDEVEDDQNCGHLLSATDYNLLEADWQIRELKPKVYCASAEMCSCHWRIKPKKGEKVIIKLNKLDEKAFSCPGVCGTSHVEIKYRKDKRARGALLCCANDILKQNMPRNWIEAEEKDVDIIISARIATPDATELFALSFETDGAKLLPSCDCTDPRLLFDPKRNPGYRCGPPPCDFSKCKMRIGGCSFGFLAFNDKVMQNKSGALPISCHKREGSAESFWYYWKQKDIEPMRIEEIHCVPCDREKDKDCKRLTKDNN